MSEPNGEPKAEQTPMCPLLLAGAFAGPAECDPEPACRRDQCAWWVPEARSCAMPVLGDIFRKLSAPRMIVADLSTGRRPPVMGRN